MIRQNVGPVVMSWVACALAAVSTCAADWPPPAQPLPARMETAPGPFKPTWESLKQYRYPEWFRDAKLGIWAVWGPESVPQQGDWYARRLYEPNDRAYKYHLEHYGHPSKFGYKDVVRLWKAENWDPDRLMSLYQKAGARYFCVIAQHHDNFDCWNSKYHRWNSVNLGPKRDITAEWKKAAEKYGLRFGVTEHLGASWGWYSVTKKADEKGPLAGVPYDGVNPQFADLYHTGNENPQGWYASNAPALFKAQWFHRIQDLVDSYQPDLLYSDGPLPYPDEVGRELLAHFYNANTRWHHGKLEAVYNCKQDSQGMWVQDLERGVMDQIRAEPWQTDTCVGGWYYDINLARSHGYKSATTVIQMLADIVSKNGNLLLNFPPRPDGTLDADELKILDAMAAWMPVNGEAIFGTRPWKIFGEGPSRVKGGMFNEDGLHYTARDIRFTTKRGALYAIALGWPEDGKLLVRSLARAAGKIDSVELLGCREKLNWSQQDDGLLVTLPARRPCEHAYALKVIAGDLQPAPLPPPPPIGRAANGTFILDAADAEIHGGSPRYEKDGQKDQIGFWHDPRDSVSWAIRVGKAGTYQVTVTYSCQPGAEGSQFAVEVDGQVLIGQSRSTQSWSTYRTDSLGKFRLARAGNSTLVVKPRTEPAWKVIGLKRVTLTPVPADVNQ